MRVLIVEDDSLLRKAMSGALGDWGAMVTGVSTEQEAIAALAGNPELLITDIRLPNNGSGVRVIETASKMRPAPLMIAVSGKASPVEAFRLAQAGVLVYITKPLDFDHFIATIEAIIADPPDMTHLVASQVGRRSYHEMVRRVRKTMLEQAMARSGGNRVQAARLLEVSRQAVQQLIKDFQLSAKSVSPPHA
jgi:two-component system response regulator RegA